jgi:hypothetical protein
MLEILRNRGGIEQDSGKVPESGSNKNAKNLLLLPLISKMMCIQQPIILLLALCFATGSSNLSSDLSSHSKLEKHERAKQEFFSLLRKDWKKKLESPKVVNYDFVEGCVRDVRIKGDTDTGKGFRHCLVTSSGGAFPVIRWVRAATGETYQVLPLSQEVYENSSFVLSSQSWSLLYISLDESVACEVTNLCDDQAGESAVFSFPSTTTAAESAPPPPPFPIVFEVVLTQRSNYDELLLRGNRGPLTYCATSLESGHLFEGETDNSRFSYTEVVWYLAARNPVTRSVFVSQPRSDNKADNRDARVNSHALQTISRDGSSYEVCCFARLGVCNPHAFPTTINYHISY